MRLWTEEEKNQGKAVSGLHTLAALWPWHTPSSWTSGICCQGPNGIKAISLSSRFSEQRAFVVLLSFPERHHFYSMVFWSSLPVPPFEILTVFFLPSHSLARPCLMSVFSYYHRAYFSLKQVTCSAQQFHFFLTLPRSITFIFLLSVNCSLITSFYFLSIFIAAQIDLSDNQINFK